MLYYRVVSTMQILFLPVVLLLTALFSLAVGTWMSALNVKYRDVRFALPFLIQLWLFVSSSFFLRLSIPKKWRWLLSESDVGNHRRLSRCAVRTSV